MSNIGWRVAVDVQDSRKPGPSVPSRLTGSANNKEGESVGGGEGSNGLVEGGHEYLENRL